MYNAKRWASLAQRSERAGRTGEARSRWAQAAMHAESLLARHPRSRWADDAMLIRGRALVHLDQYSNAVAVLDQAAREAQSQDARDQALLLHGRANLALRRLPEALESLDRSAQARREATRDESQWYRARTLLAMGRPEAALAALGGTRQPLAALDRVRAALASGDTALVGSFADSLAGKPYVEAQWLPLLDSLGAAGLTTVASRVVLAQVRRSDLGPGEKARLLLADGERLRRARRNEARERYQAVSGLVPDSSEARTARVRLIELRLRDALSEQELAEALPSLRQIIALGGAPARDAEGLARLLLQADEAGTDSTAPDAFWFLRAEIVRDSIGAAALAASRFAAMADRFPDSPWTPKGLLAALAAGHPSPDSLRAILVERYSGSPYLAAIRGDVEAQQSFAALEDSLYAVLATRLLPGNPAQAEPGRRGGLEGPDERSRPRQAAPRPAQPGPGRPVIEP